MDENGKAVTQRPRRWPRVVRRTLFIALAVLLLFHRPIIFRLGRSVANHYAAKENLRIDCSLEGTIFTSLVVRNLHVIPIGPTIVESIDVDQIRADYSLLAWLRNGPTELLENAELRRARIVLDPAKASLEPKVARPDERITLFPFYPKRLRIADVNLVVRSTKAEGEFALEHFDLDLDPKNPGELRIARLQLPNGPAWKSISGRTSYTNRNFTIGDIVLDKDSQIRLVALDLSRISSRSLEAMLDASLAGGTVTGSASLSETSSSLKTRFRLVADNVSLDVLRGYIGRPPGFLEGDMQHLAITTEGTLDAPRTWNGTVEAQINNLRQEQFFFDRCVVKAAARDGIAVLEAGEATTGSNTIQLKGAAELPENIRQFGQSPTRFEISASLPDLQALTAKFPQPLQGSATLAGTGEIKDALLHADLTFGGGPIGFGNGSAAQVSGTLNASKKMPATNKPDIYYTNLRSQIHLEMIDVRAGENLFDSVVADWSIDGASLKLERMVAVRKENAIEVTGNYRLPDDFMHALTQPANLNLSLGVTELGDYWPEDSPNRITGPLQLYGQVTVTNGKANGEVTFYGSNLKFRNLIVPQVSGQASISNNVVYLNDLTANLNERDYIAGHGVFSLETPYPYSGKIFARIEDLARLKPILAATGNSNELAGALLIDWEGSGQGSQFKNSGKLKLILQKGRYANLQALQANVDATYSPEGLDIPTLFLASDKVNFQAVLAAHGSTLEISKIEVDQGQAKYAAGYVSLPFVWKNIGTSEPLFPSDGKVLVNFQSESLDLKRLFEDLGVSPRATGSVNVKLNAEGTFAQLSAKLEMQGSNLHSSDYPKLDPATFGLVADLQNNQLTLNGTFQQSKIQPVQLTANLPFEISKIIADRKFDDNSPVTARLQLPRSSINFVRQFVPALTQIDGDLALDANVNGTIAKPVLSGSGDLTINMARLNNPSLPSVSGLRSRLTFNGDVLNFERLNGDLAGGPFTISGRVVFPKLTEPNFDFQLKAQSILVARNDSLTARADADVKVIGPWTSANVIGNVSLTNSQFLKNIDLIPIGLPGRPAPQPPSDRPDFSITQPPIRDWKFDVIIRTKDPFLLRGNLANGGAIVDLHLTGTGARPALQGLVRLENVEATLPFSRLEIAQGFLYFDPSDSFNPKIDLHGTSLIRDYTVHVYVYGTSLAPEAVFNSEPPLPQEEIISLLATGVTRGELTGNNNVLAGRAAMLLVQQLYQKVFKKGQAPKSNSAFDRLQVDIGQVDPRTGQQTATARYKVNDKFIVVGDLAVGGDFRGMVKYLIRFK